MSKQIDIKIFCGYQYNIFTDANLDNIWAMEPIISVNVGYQMILNDTIYAHKSIFSKNGINIHKYVQTHWKGYILYIR